MANTKSEEWVQVLGVLLFLGVVVVLIIFVVNKFIAFFNYIFSTNEPPKYFVTTRAHYTPESIQLKNGPFGYRTINVVDESSEVDDAVEQLINGAFGILGFDCEWTNIIYPKPVGLLQLATSTGYCALFRLRRLGRISESLKRLLADPTIIKLGVDPHGDAEKLWNDHGILVNGVFDIRFFPASFGFPAEGLKKMARNYLKVQMGEYRGYWDWERANLIDEQIEYAASDAQAAAKIFCWFMDMYSLANIRSIYRANRGNKFIS